MKKMFPDIIPNIRSIHQVLVLTTLALAIGLFSPNKGIDVSSAIADLEKITSLTKDWDPRIIEQAYRDQIYNPMQDDLYFYNYWKMELQIEEINWMGNKELPTHVISLNAPIDLFLGWTYGYEFGDEGTVTKTPPPNSLQEFLEFWNKARRVERLFFSFRSPFRYAYVQRNPGDPVQKVQLTILDWDYSYSPDYNGYNGIYKPNIFGIADVEEKDRDLYGLTYLSSEDDPYFAKVWIPTSANTETIYIFNATSYLCRKMGLDLQNRDCDAGFEQAFPELYFFTKDIRDLSFGGILIALKQKEDDEFRKNIDFFGFQIPSLMLYGGGTLLIVLMQFYFRLHLNILNSTISKIDELPAWIGLFPDTLSRFITMLTANIIPFLMVITLNIQFILHKLDKKLYDLDFMLICLTILVESALAVFVYFDFMDLWKILDTTNRYDIKPARVRAGVRRKNRN